MKLEHTNLASIKRKDGALGRTYKIVLKDGREFERLSTTTRLSSLHNEHLVQWREGQVEQAHKTAAALAFRAGGDKTDFLVAYELHLKRLKQEAKQHNAATIGDEIHTAIDRTVQFMITGENPPVHSFTCEEAENAFENWTRWVDQVNFRPAASEFPVYSEYSAGTIDCIGFIEDNFCVIDWKTGSKVYPEYELQIADYFFSVRDLLTTQEVVGGTHLSYGVIVHIPKTPGSDVRQVIRRYPEMLADYKTFKAICVGDTWNRESAKRPPRPYEKF